MSRWYELKADAVAPSEHEDPVISHIQSLRAFLDIHKLPVALIGGIMPSVSNKSLHCSDTFVEPVSHVP